MDVLWERGEASVHEVRDRLDRKKALAYTTVLTTLRDTTTLHECPQQHQASDSFPWEMSPLFAACFSDLLQTEFGIVAGPQPIRVEQWATLRTPVCQ